MVHLSKGPLVLNPQDFFAGIGGWEHAFDLLPQSPFGPFENREVVSVELDLAPAASLAKTTKRVLRKPRSQCGSH